MTYAQFLEQLQQLSKDRLQDTATVYVVCIDEYIAVSVVKSSTETDNDVLDPGHIYMQVG